MLTPCLGRDQVQRTLTAALAEARWVSIVGPPGSGKTLLARHAAADFDEVAWVDARHVAEIDTVLVRALAALAFEVTPGDTLVGALGRALDGWDGLLVLDGLDLDSTGAGSAIRRILEGTSHGRILVTAHTSARQPEEHVVRVGPLPIPLARARLEGPAVDLFLDRIRVAGGPVVDLASHDSDVRRLLSATAGLPLLIEQAAAQSALVGLGNAAPAVSLDEAVDSACALLDDDQRTLLHRLGLLDFPAGVEILSHVMGLSVGATTQVAAELVRRSLVDVLPDGRFDLLSPVRSRARALASAEDRAATQRGLLEWADVSAPEHDNVGAADAAWLAELPAMRHAVLSACADPRTRADGYSIANRIFSSLYTAMRTREALEVLEGALGSGDGPPAIGAQVARRAGIAASEARGTYEGLSLLERADEHAAAAERPHEQLAKNASIRAEMHLDAGELAAAEAEARRALELDPEGSIARQATRTLADVHVSQGRFAEAIDAATAVMPGRGVADERWIDLSARTLLARVALEQGRVAEAVATARSVVEMSRELAEDRVGLLAETLLRDVDPGWQPSEVVRESLPWAVRLPVLAQDARDLFAAGDHQHAAGLAADVVALADSARLGRDGVEGRLLLGRALLALGDHDQAAATFLTALQAAARMPMPLRSADALDGLASVAAHRGLREARELAATAAALRLPCAAVPWGYAATFAVEPAGSAPSRWVHDGQLSGEAVAAIASLFTAPTSGGDSVLDALTAAERQVAQRVARGLTSRQIAAELFVSPRTVDAHLTHIYRKLDINSRARLAALVAES